MIKRYYRIPMRKGALMSKSDVKNVYFLLIISIALAVMFAFSLSAAERSEANDFWTLVCWFLVVLFSFATTIYVSCLYGYYHRHDIDTGDATQVDLSKAYLGGVLAAIIAPFARWLIGLFGG